MCNLSFYHTGHYRVIAIDKSTKWGIIIPTLEIIQPNFLIVVVTTISEWVNCCNTTSGSILSYRAYAPGIVRVLNNNLSILVYDSNNIVLQILDEVVRSIVVDNTADRLFIIVERNECIIAPSLAQNFCAVKCVCVFDTVYSLTCTNAVCIVSICVAIKRLQLSSLFPSQCVTEVGCRVALCIYYTTNCGCVNKKLRTSGRDAEKNIRINDIVSSSEIIINMYFLYITEHTANSGIFMLHCCMPYWLLYSCLISNL